jgi:hypothetical protein
VGAKAAVATGSQHYLPEATVRRPGTVEVPLLPGGQPPWSEAWEDVVDIDPVDQSAPAQAQ